MNTYNMNQYYQTQVSTASPEQILIMLYDGAIRFTRQAIIGVEEGKPEMRRHGISKSLAIISEFARTLDHKIGSHFAEDLDALYNFMINELTEANIGNDVEKLKVVETLLVDLRGTWAEAIELNKKQMATAVAVSQAPNVQHGSFSVSR
ncbi:MAG: flagellar protein FliS [Desulforhopalus sp.]|jgi:flagellar protein FliS